MQYHAIPCGQCKAIFDSKNISSEIRTILNYVIWFAVNQDCCELSCIDFLRLQWLSELSLYLMTLFVCFVLLWRSCDQQVVKAMIKQKDCCVWIWTLSSAPLCHSFWWWSYWILIVKVWKMRTAYAVDVGTFLAKSWSRFFQLKYSSLPDFSILIGPSSSSV